MVGALFDTNILIDHLRGDARARDEIGRYTRRAISVVGVIEVLVGTPAEAEAITRAFLLGFERIALDYAVAERAVTLRRAHRLKLPDAVVWASAQAHGLILVTRDTSAFPASDPGVRIPYHHDA